MVRGPERMAAIHEPAHNGDAGVVVVLVNRIDERLKRRRDRRDVVVRPFAIPPAVVAAAPVGRFVVHLFPVVLAHVGDDQRSRSAVCGIVEAVAPRVAQTETPDLGPCSGRSTAEERVRGRYLITGRIRIRHVDIDAQHLAKPFRRRLRAILRIVSRAAVAEADVEKAVGAKRQVAAVVIGEGLRDERGSARAAPTQIETRARIGDQRVARSHEPRDDGVAGRVGEVHEEAAAGRVIGRERQAEQTPLAPERDRALEIEEGSRQDRPVLNDADASRLLDDELNRAIGRVLHEPDRRCEARRVKLGPELCVCVGGGDEAREEHDDRNRGKSPRASSPAAVTEFCNRQPGEAAPVRPQCEPSARTYCGHCAPLTSNDHGRLLIGVSVLSPHETPKLVVKFVLDFSTNQSPVDGRKTVGSNLPSPS